MKEIIELLNIKSKVVAIKTDTVYGLICNANDKDAVGKIYNIKKRDGKKPLGIFVKNKNEIFKYIDVACLNDKKNEIIEKYWPGALTIIFKKKYGVYDYLSCGNDTIGIRIPNDKVLIDILTNVDFPLAETSCNLSGEDPYIDYEMIKKKFSDKVDMIVDGGKVLHNVSSTVVSFIDDEPKIIRPGDIIISE